MVEARSTALGIRDQFDSYGYAVLKGVFESDVVQNARLALGRYVDRLAQELLDRGKVSNLLVEEPFETRMYRLYKDHLEDAPTSFGHRGKELHDEEFFPIFFSSFLLDVVEEFLGGEIRLYPNYQARPKLPDWEGTRVLWHQDGAYTGGKEVEALPMVNVWAPLVPAREENGCMQFVPGSHRLGIVPHERKEYYLEIAQEVLAPRLDEVVTIELDPGDVVIFSNLLFHQGLPNRAKTIRWSLDWRYEDARHPTGRTTEGHIARSKVDPSQAVRDAAQWARLSYK